MPYLVVWRQCTVLHRPRFIQQIMDKRNKRVIAADVVCGSWNEETEFVHAHWGGERRDDLALCLGWTAPVCATLWRAFSHPVIEMEKLAGGLKPLCSCHAVPQCVHIAYLESTWTLELGKRVKRMLARRGSHGFAFSNMKIWKIVCCSSNGYLLTLSLFQI